MTFTGRVGIERFYQLKQGEGLPGRIDLAPHYAVKARLRDTNGHFSAFVATIKQQIPLHVHEYADESFYMLDGAMELWMGDRFHIVEKGDWVCAPFGIPHAPRPISDVDPVTLVVQSPGGFEEIAEIMLEHQETTDRDFTDPELVEKLTGAGWTLLDGDFWKDKPKPEWVPRHQHNT